MLYQSLFCPAVEYTLSQSFLSPEQLKTIQTKSFRPIYGKCGFNRNTAADIMCGPINLGGGGFAPLKAVTGTGHVIAFLKFWRSPEEEPGKLLRILVSWSQFCAGVDFSIMKSPDQSLPHLDR